MKEIKRYVLFLDEPDRSLALLCSLLLAFYFLLSTLPASCSTFAPAPLWVAQTETKRPKTLFSLANNRNLPETNLKRIRNQPVTNMKRKEQSSHEKSKRPRLPRGEQRTTNCEQSTSNIEHRTTNCHMRKFDAGRSLTVAALLRAAAHTTERKANFSYVVQAGTATGKGNKMSADVSEKSAGDMRKFDIGRSLTRRR